MRSLEVRRESRDSSWAISALREERVLVRARCWARSGGMAEWVVWWVERIWDVSVCERVERRASFWGFGGIGGGVVVAAEVVGRGVSKGEVRRSIDGAGLGAGLVVERGGCLVP